MEILYDHVFFDFDGTLADTSEGIISALSQTLEHFGVAVEDRAFLRRFIGPPLGDAFCEYYGFSGEQAEQAVAYYRTLYGGGEMFRCRPYPGIYDCLAFLKGCGVKICTATSKPEPYTDRILAYHGMEYLFDRVYGADPENGRYRKKEVLEYALENSGLKHEKQRALLIGDTKYDIIGAKEVGIDTVGVLYGFGPLADLVRYEADHIVRSAREISQYVIRI